VARCEEKEVFASGLCLLANQTRFILLRFSWPLVIGTNGCRRPGSKFGSTNQIGAYHHPSMSVFKIIPTTQQYDWGKPGKNSKVAQLASAAELPGFELDEAATYAEVCRIFSSMLVGK
jgi:hypothetical protein